MSTDRLSGAPLYGDEVDYDDLIINRTWRAYEADRPSEVRYFMYEFAQRNPGEAGHWHGYKAVRFARLTRVPRWLRQQGAGIGRPGYSQMAYVLAALREQGILFVQLVTKTPEIPLIFAYGVQAVGASPEEAQQLADEGFSALCGLLDGTFQQIEYAPISLDEAERIARYSATWREIAMARGRPMLSSESIGASALLDGNRTDVEQTHNQMEAFIRGMSESPRGFMMSLVTVPLLVEDMSLAWRNVSTKLSEVRSETHGMRAFTAGVALPLAVGNSMGSSHGDSHGTTASHGLGESAGQSHSLGYSESQTIAEGVSETHTHGISQTVTDGVSASQTVGESQSSSVGVSETDTTGVSASQQVGTGQSLSDSTSTSVAAGQSLSNNVSESWGESAGISEGRSISESAGVSQSESIAAGRSIGESYSQSISDARGASITDTQGVNRSAAQSETQTMSLSNALADSLQNGRSFQSGSNVNAGLLGFGGGGSSGSGETSSSGLTNTNTLGLSHAGGLTRTEGFSSSLAQGLSQTTTFGESSGVNTGQSLTATNSVGSSHSQTAGQSVSASHSQTASHGASLGIGQSLTETAGLGRSVGANVSASEGLGQSHSLAAGRTASESVGASQSASTAASHSVAQGTSESVAQGASRTMSSGAGSSETAGTSAGLSQNQALADAYTVAMSRQASQTGSLGVVPNFGVTVSKQTLDAAKQVVGDILEATMRRYIDGVEGGAYLYQLFLVTEDRETLMAGAALLKSAFWGPGSHQERLVQPFHMITDLDDPELDVDDVEAERDRLLAHAQAFTSYRRREPVMEIIEPFRYSSYATCGELSAFARPPVAESLGLLAVHDSSPVMAMPGDRQHRELTLGYLYNGERGKVSDTKYGLDVGELTHVLLSGVTGAGKALALDTPIPTPTGWTTMGQLVVGDRVLDERGKAATVTFATGAMHERRVFDVRFSDGTTITADADHLWLASDALGRVQHRRERQVRHTERRARVAAEIERLRSHAIAGSFMTISEAGTVTGSVARVRRVIKDRQILPGSVKTVEMSQSCGATLVVKTQPVAAYDQAELFFALAEDVEARAAQRPVERVVSTLDMFNTLQRQPDGSNWAVRVAEALDLPDADLPIPPYLLGVWLGDGTTAQGHCTSVDDEIVERIRTLGEVVRRHAPSSDRAPRWHVDGLRARLRATGLLGNKHIPAAYLRASRHQRLELLRGLMDTGGYIDDKGNLGFEQANERLGLDALELVRTLGMAPSYSEGRATLDGHDLGPTYTVAFTTTEQVFALSGKAARLNDEVRTTNLLRYVTSIVEVPSVAVRCIQVDSPSRLYLAGESMVPTHNTTTLMRLLSELCHAERTVTTPAVPGGVPQSRTVQPSIFAIDWMRNLRHLGSIVEPVRIDPTTGERRGRFQFFSVRDTELGAFTWNPLAVPDNGMNPVEWLNAMADNMVASWNLGEFGRSLIAEYLDRLYSANRLEPFDLRPARYDDAGTMIRPALVLDPIPAEDLPADAIGVDPVTGDPVANVYTYPELSRLVGVHHLAIIVAAEIEAAATLEGGRMGGTSNRDRLQSLWRRIQYYGPDGQLSDIITCDDTLEDRRCLTLADVVDPDRGLVTVVEADGLDQANRRFILGSMLLAIYRKGLHQGEGYFNQDGKGLGLFVVVDEAHEVYASQGEDEDAFSSSTRIALYESLHRRARALGIRLIDVVQNPGDISEAITSNTATVFTHRVYAKADRDRIFSLLNWSNMLGQQLREYRFLGELPIGHCIARLSPQRHFLEAAPVHFVSEPAALGTVTNQHLTTWAQWRDGVV